jgi:hypothetical protein
LILTIFWQKYPIFENLDFQEIKETPEMPAGNISQETPPPTEKKRGRGRPKKTEQHQEPKPQQKEKTGFELMDEMQNQIEKNTIQEPTAAPGAITSPLENAARSIIDGYMLLTICDVFFPMVFKMFWKEAKKLKDKDIRLSKDQKEHLEPLADEIAQAALSFMDPAMLFIVLVGASYKQNIDDAIQSNKFIK